MKKILLILATALLSTAIYAQNVGINTDGSDPADSVLLEVRTTNGATLPTSMVSVVNDNNGATNRTGFQLYNSVTGANSLWNLYNPGGASTDFRINNAGNDYMTILNSGHVGIGTITPAGKLHVHGDGVADGGIITRFTSDDNRPFDIYSPIAGDLTSPFQLYTLNAFEFLIEQPAGVLSTLNIEADADVRIESDNNANMLFVDYSADAVGIGTAAPDHELHIVSPATGGGPNGPLRLTSRANKDNHIRYDYPSNSNSFWLLGADEDVTGGEPNSFGLWNGDRSTFDMIVSESNGYVGIGTRTPSAQLDVDGSAIFNESGAAVDFRVEGDTEANLLFVDGSADRVGIGTAAPDCELHITGNVNGGADGVLRLTPFGTRENYILFDEDDTGTGAADWYIGVEKNPGDGFGIYQNVGPSVPGVGAFRIFIDRTTSFVGIGGNVFNPQEMLTVVGNGLFTGNVTAACGVLTCSDKRYKKDFNKIGSALDMISQVDGYTYNFRTNEFPNLNFDSTQQVGFIAQELQEVLPEAVHEDRLGYLSVDYGKVTPLLLMAIKEQQAIIEAQKQEITELKAEASISSTETNQRLEELEVKLNLLLNKKVITAEK